MGGGPTASKVSVNEETGLSVSAVYGCVRVISEDLAKLPLIVYERQGEGRRRATEHPLYPLLHDSPNLIQTSFTFRELLTGHLETWGNGYAEIIRDSRMRPIALEPRLPDRTKPSNKGPLRYMYDRDLDSNWRSIQPENMLHVPGFGFNGVVGRSVIRQHREAIGLALATEKFGAGFFGSGTRLSGLLSHPARLGEKGVKQVRESWKRLQDHDVGVLEEGMTWTQLGIPPEDAQFLQTRRFQTEEICRIWRVPPHKVMNLERATYSNIESQEQQYLGDTLMSRLVRWEQEINRKLFTAVERERYYAEFLVDAILRADIQARFASYALAIQWGIMNRDEIRARENLNPIPDGDGKTFWAPLNMTDAAKIGEEYEPRAPRTPPPEPERAVPPQETREVRAGRSLGLRRRTQAAYRRLIEEVARRVVRREVQLIRTAARKMLTGRDASDFRAWLESFLAEHEQQIGRSVTPVFLSFAEQMADLAAEEAGGEVQDLAPFVRNYVKAYAARHAGSSLGQMLQLLDEADEADLLDIIEARLVEWEEKRPEKIGRREAKQAGSAFVKAAWIGAGVTVFRWITSGENCPLCDELEGKVVGIDKPFVGEGDTVGADGDAPLTAKRDFGHPPLHDGCDCDIGVG